VRAQHEAAEAAADVDEAIAGGQTDLAAHMVDLLALRRLERRRALRPVGAGVHLQRLVEPQAVEGLGQPVVRACVRLRLRRAAVGTAQLVQAVLHRVQGLELAVEARAHAGGEGGAEVAFDVDLLVEVGLQQPDMAAREGRQHGAVGVENDAEARGARAPLQDRAVRQHDREAHAGALAQRVDRAAQQRMHGQSPSSWRARAAHAPGSTIEPAGTRAGIDLGQDRPTRRVAPGDRAGAPARDGPPVQPVLRSPAAMPLIEMWMPRCSRSSEPSPVRRWR
jgi:hypothetical protein